MSNLENTLKQDLAEALKNKAHEMSENGVATTETAATVSTLKYITSELKKERLSTGKELTDKDVQGKLRKASKSYREMSAKYAAAATRDEADVSRLEGNGKTAAEDAYRRHTDASRTEEISALVLESYLPKELDEDATREAVDKAIADVGATSKRDMGNVMKALKAVDGIDMKVASGLVGKALS